MKKYRDPDIVPIHHIKMTDIVSMNSTMQGSLYFCYLFQILKTANATGVVPVRALLCSYKCFNKDGHDYYGVAFA